MSVKIRLTRLGDKKSPFYRVVVADSRKSRDGEVIDNLGYYNPLVDNDNCVGQGVLPPYLVPQDKGYKNDWAKMAYHGKAAAESATVSSLAKAAGWDETVWDLSGALPKLK